MLLSRKVLPILVCLTGFSSASRAIPVVGNILPVVEIEGEKGGRTNGDKWSSAMIKDHLWLLFYVDPDHKDDNQNLEKALKNEKFPEEDLGSIGVINMAATWLPDVALKPALEAKQKDYPKVVYVLDRKKALLEKWKLVDDDYNVLLFGKDGQVLYANHGILDSKAIADLIAIIRKNLSNTKPPSTAP